MTVKHCGFPAVKVEAAFSDGPGTLPADADWTDLTDRTMGFDVRRGRGSQFQQPQPGQATVKFNNDDGSLSPSSSWDGLIGADDPVGWWKFDEASGNFADSSGNSLTLSATGVVAYQETGQVDTGAQVDGTSGVSRAFSATLNPAAITVETWVRADALAAGGGIWSSHNATDKGYFAYLDADGTVRAGTYPSAAYVTSAPGAAALDAWVHVAWTNDGTTGSLYIDGTLVDSGAQAYTPLAATNTFVVGKDGIYPVSATYDELVVYDRVLSAGRIRAHYSGISVPVGAQVRLTTSHYRARVHADSPAGHWLLDETSGTTAADDSGNGRNGTHTGPTVGQTSLVALEAGGTGQQPYPRRSVSYDGSNDYTEVAHHADWVPDSGGWTLHLLCRFTAVGAATTRNMISKSDSTTTDWLLGLNTSNQLLFRYIDVGATNRDLTVAWTPTVATVYHLAATWDGTYQRLYVDGELVATSADMSANVPRSGSGRPLRFGRHQNVYGYNGRLDEVAIVQACLTDESIADLAEMALDGTPLFHGYAEQWPNRWEAQTVGMSTVTAYDGLAQLGRRDLALGDWRDWTMQYRPSAYYRLDDDEGTAVAADETGRYPAPVSHDAEGLSGIGVDWEFEVSGPPGVNDGSAATFNGAFLHPDRDALASGTDEFTVETVMSVHGNQDGSRYLLVAEDADGSNTDLILQLITFSGGSDNMSIAGTTNDDFGNVGSHDVSWLGSGTLPGTDHWVHVMFSRHVVGGDEHLLLYVDGIPAEDPWPSYTVEDLDSEGVYIGGPSLLVGNFLDGDIVDEFAIYPFAVEPHDPDDLRPDQTLRWTQHRAEWMLTRWADDLPSARIQRILDLARWPVDANAESPFIISAVDNVPLSAPSSQSALASCQDAATTNGSVFYCDGNGNFVFDDPDTTPRWTFSDAGTGLSYHDLTVANDDQYLHTAAEVRDGDGKQFTAVDDTAAGLYGLNTHNATLTTVKPNVAQAFADWHVYRYAYPRIRISQLEVANPTSAAAGVCMTLQPGQQVQVQRSDHDMVIDDPVYVDEIAHTWDATTRAVSTTMQLSPAGQDGGVFVLDTSLLDSGDRLAYA